jgi:S-adenosylmethionine synthetase
VDRSAAYMCRWVAKNVVSSGLADRAEIQLAYAIGHPEPTSITLDCFGTEKVDESKIEKAVKEVFSFKPADIVSQLNLLRPIYRETTHYGHFGKAGLPWEDTSLANDLKQAAC